MKSRGGLVRVFSTAITKARGRRSIPLKNTAFVADKKRLGLYGLDKEDFLGIAEERMKPSTDRR
jgi:hypothetical protein